jgi:hypothetical protein
MPVHMNVMQHQLVGAYVSKLAMSESRRPPTVEGLMEGLAGFVNDALGVEAMTAIYDEPTRTWRIHGVIEMIGIDRDATIDYAAHTPQKLTLRLPDPDLLADSRNVAVAFDAGRSNAQLYTHRFYYDYIRGDGAYRISNSDFLDSRVADYVFSHCR